MAKLCILALVCFAAIVQVTFARDIAEAINNNIREQLKGYQKFLAEDDGSHKEDLTKLIGLAESALKTDNADEKQKIWNTLQEHFTPEFNKYITEKLEEYQVNDDIEDAIKFYKSIESAKPEFKDEITKTITTLETILKETNLKQKEEAFLSIDKSFTPDFQKFLKDNALPNVNRELQKTEEFFETLLADSTIKFQAEIKELKDQALAALADIPIEEKQQTLYKITNPDNKDLYNYLQTKFVELN